MYGLQDWQGRIISFFVRLVQIMARGFVLVFWAVFALALFLAYLALPIFAAFAFLQQFLALLTN